MVRIPPALPPAPGDPRSDPDLNDLAQCGQHGAHLARLGLLRVGMAAADLLRDIDIRRHFERRRHRDGSERRMRG